MTKACTLLLLLLLVVGCAPVVDKGKLSEVAEAPTEPYSGASDGVLIVNYRNGPRVSGGSGFIVRQQGGLDVLCTAAHVINSPDSVLELFYADGVTPVPFTAGRTYVNEDNDSAFVVLSGLPSNVKRWEVGEARSRGTITSIGYPGFYQKREVINGKIINIKMFVSTPINSGMSGGIVIENGKAVGIVTHQAGNESWCTVLADAIEAVR